MRRLVTVSGGSDYSDSDYDLHCEIARHVMTRAAGTLLHCAKPHKMRR
jgi:hypothetical protein